MNRFLLWLCSKGWHRGDMVWVPRKGTTIECLTCGQTVHQR